ncbi:hypothetical protein BpHYR1_044299 [Brachionus plicatilis]|uniref:Uncharacterized protein n=1 Tax=Brachionus plicatilis TaxID=10195 RepID=A0A3M7SAM6_BRAPC|nr:hypothetical protein BpHYR1_044299 [Brachionus plicatilis]
MKQSSPQVSQRSTEATVVDWCVKKDKFIGFQTRVCGQNLENSPSFGMKSNPLNSLQFDKKIYFFLFLSEGYPRKVFSSTDLGTNVNGSFQIFSNCGFKAFLLIITFKMKKKQLLGIHDKHLSFGTIRLENLVPILLYDPPLNLLGYLVVVLCSNFRFASRLIDYSRIISMHLQTKKGIYPDIIQAYQSHLTKSICSFFLSISKEIPGAIINFRELSSDFFKKLFYSKPFRTKTNILGLLQKRCNKIHKTITCSNLTNKSIASSNASNECSNLLKIAVK